MTPTADHSLVLHEALAVSDRCRRKRGRGAGSVTLFDRRVIAFLTYLHYSPYGYDG